MAGVRFQRHRPRTIKTKIVKKLQVFRRVNSQNCDQHVKAVLPALTEGQHFSQDDRKLLSLPPRYGGLCIPIFSEIADAENKYSKMSCKQLSGNMKSQTVELSFDTKTMFTLRTLLNGCETKITRKQWSIWVNMNEEQKRANEIARMKGASTWLTSLPSKVENNILNKRKFHDAVRLRYRWHLKYIPCGKKFSVDHALSCLKGGLIHQRDLFGQIAEVSNDVEIEPALLPVTCEHLQATANRQDEARLDWSIGGFWQRGQWAFFDIRVLNPFAPTYRSQSLPAAFSKNDRERKRSYAQRGAWFIHSAGVHTIWWTQSWNREVCAWQYWPQKLQRSSTSQSNWFRAKLSFALHRSAILLCNRGSRSLPKKHFIDTGNIEVSSVTSLI